MRTNTHPSAFETLSEYKQKSVIEFLQTLQVLPPGTESLIIEEDGQSGRWPTHRHGIN